MGANSCLGAWSVFRSDGGCLGGWYAGGRGTCQGWGW